MELKNDGESPVFKVRLSGRAYNKRTMKPHKSASKVPQVCRAPVVSTATGALGADAVKTQLDRAHTRRCEFNVSDGVVCVVLVCPAEGAVTLFSAPVQEYTVDQRNTHWFSLYHSLQHYKYHTYLMCKDEVSTRPLCLVSPVGTSGQRWCSLSCPAGGVPAGTGGQPGTGGGPAEVSAEQSLGGRAL